jgi:protein required for attachment to host cells
MVRSVITWILVADGACARVFEHAGPGKGVAERPEFASQGARDPARAYASDRPGRTKDRFGHGRHAMEMADSKSAQEAAFLDSVLAGLETALAASRFQRLVIVAAPRALGTLRKQLPANLDKVLYTTLDKDLTRSPVEAIEKQFAKVLSV